MFDLCKRNDDDSNKKRKKNLVWYLSLTSSDFDVFVVPTTSVSLF